MYTALNFVLSDSNKQTRTLTLGVDSRGTSTVTSSYRMMSGFHRGVTEIIVLLVFYAVTDVLGAPYRSHLLGLLDSRNLDRSVAQKRLLLPNYSA